MAGEYTCLVFRTMTPPHRIVNVIFREPVPPQMLPAAPLSATTLSPVEITSLAFLPDGPSDGTTWTSGLTGLPAADSSHAPAPTSIPPENVPA